MEASEKVKDENEFEKEVKESEYLKDTEILARNKQDEVLALVKAQTVRVVIGGRPFKHVPQGASCNPKNYNICGGKNSGKDQLDKHKWYCTNPAGKQTDHLGYGRCFAHGGNSTIAGPNNPNFIHGRKATVFKSRLREKFELAASEDENPLNLLPELEAQKQLFYMGLDTLERKLRGEAEDLGAALIRIEDVRGLGNDVVNTASRIVNMRNQTALTAAEIMTLQVVLGDAIEKFVNPDERAACIAFIAERVPWSD